MRPIWMTLVAGRWISSKISLEMSSFKSIQPGSLPKEMKFGIQKQLGRMLTYEAILNRQGVRETLPSLLTYMTFSRAIIRNQLSIWMVTCFMLTRSSRRLWQRIRAAKWVPIKLKVQRTIYARLLPCNNTQLNAWIKNCSDTLFNNLVSLVSLFRIWSNNLI